jgi:ubiquitin-conjugating enzyme E2 variant
MSASFGNKSLLDQERTCDAGGVVEHPAPLHSFLEHATTYTFPVLFLLNLYWGSARLYELELLWMLALAVPLGLVSSDFVTGMLHWIADTYGSENTPVLGPSVVKPFRLHHLYPRDICTHNLVTTLGNSCIIAVPALSLSLYLIWVTPESQWLAVAVVCLSILAVATVLTNLFHKWAHQENPAGIVRWLQRSRLVLEPAHHERHHTEPFDKHYCITNGWLNPILNKIGFFRKIEAALRLVGIEPARDIGAHGEQLFK